MTRRLLTALVLLACTASCTDASSTTVAGTTLPTGFLVASESDKQPALSPAPTTTSTASSQPATLPVSLLMPSELESGQALDELTIEYRESGCYIEDSDVNWFTFRPGAPLTVLVEGHRSAGGRWTRDTLALDEADITALSEMLDLFRRGFEMRTMDQMAVSLELIWKLKGETVATEMLRGDMTPYLGDEAPPFIPAELIGRCRNKR